MAVHHLVDDGQVGATQVPDVLAMDNVPVGTGASIVVGVAAAIALVLTILVATLSSVVSASAMPAVRFGAPAMTDVVTASSFANPVPATYRITDVLPARDGTFAVVSGTEGEASLAPVVVGTLFLLTLAATAHAARGLRTAATGPVRTRREPRTAKPSKGR